MILKDVDIPTVYYGCEEFSENEMKNCFNNKVSTFNEREFNLTISKGLHFSEP